jgi:hypothetical protein
MVIGAKKRKRTLRKGKNDAFIIKRTRSLKSGKRDVSRETFDFLVCILAVRGYNKGKRSVGERASPVLARRTKKRRKRRETRTGARK